MHDILFKNYRTLTLEDINKFAEEIGLDMEKFKKDMESQALKDQIKTDQAHAKEIGATGTPAFYINGKKFGGAKPFNSFKAAIDEKLGKPTDKAARAKPEIYELSVDNSPWKGTEGAPVTILEFTDFQCPYCARAAATMDQLVAAYPGQVILYVKNNPLPFHKNAPGAALASLAANAQGKYWEMYDLLFKNYRELSMENIHKFAEEIGLDMEKFKKDMEKQELKDQIKSDQMQAKQAKATSTPTFFINGRKMSGAQPLNNFKKVVVEELAKLKAEPKPENWKTQISFYDRAGIDSGLANILNTGNGHFGKGLLQIGGNYHSIIHRNPEQGNKTYPYSYAQIITSNIQEDKSPGEAHRNGKKDYQGDRQVAKL